MTLEVIRLKKNKSQQIYKQKNILNICKTIHEQNRIKSDVNGGYTGTPSDGIFPVQDVDDL